MLPDRIQTMCADLFGQLCQNGGPEQKVIIFCTGEIHADRVAMQLNNLYVNWCREQGRVVSAALAKLKTLLADPN